MRVQPGSPTTRSALQSQVSSLMTQLPGATVVSRDISQAKSPRGLRSLAPATSPGLWRRTSLPSQFNLQQQISSLSEPAQEEQQPLVSRHQPYEDLLTELAAGVPCKSLCHACKQWSHDRHIPQSKHDIIAHLVLSADLHQGTLPLQEQESDYSAVSSPKQEDPQSAVEAETSQSSASSSDSTASDHNANNADDKQWKQLRRLCSRSLLVGELLFRKCSTQLFPTKMLVQCSPTELVTDGTELTLN